MFNQRLSFPLLLLFDEVAKRMLRGGSDSPKDRSSSTVIAVPVVNVNGDRNCKFRHESRSQLLNVSVPYGASSKQMLDEEFYLLFHARELKRCNFVDVLVLRFLEPRDEASGPGGQLGARVNQPFATANETNDASAETFGNEPVVEHRSHRVQLRCRLLGWILGQLRASSGRLCKENLPLVDEWLASGGW